MMSEWFKAPLVVVIAFYTVQFRAILANCNSSTSGDEKEVKEGIKNNLNLFLAWIERPPYTTSPQNESLDNEVHGVVREALFRYIFYDCSYKHGFKYLPKTNRVDTEFQMIELLSQNRVHLAAPVFERANPQYSKFPFVKLVDYPGTDFITTEDETKGLHVVLDAVLKSWPLFAVTLILTAMAGVIIWALDTYWNKEEFPRSFIRGSWDGFWWSFISMTTVGYGDKSPKSVVARVFSIIWIMLGLIIMAIFMANITSALTALSLQLEPSSLVDVKVAVLSNGTEYQHAMDEKAKPTVFERIDDMIQAVKSKQVDGMLLDRYTASYYQSRIQLESLYTVKTFELQGGIGILFNRNREKLAECLLNYHRTSIWMSAQIITGSFKLAKQMPPRNVNVFDVSSPFIKKFMYVSLGLLVGLLLIGTVGSILCRKSGKHKQRNSLNAATVRERMIPATIHEDIEVAKRFLRQTQEQFDRLEIKVSKLKYHQ